MADASKCVDELLNLLSDALVMLRERQPRLAETILGQLDALEPDSPSVAKKVRLRVLDHRWDFALAEGCFEKAAEYCREAMEIAGPSANEYYMFASSLVRTHLNAGQKNIALDTLCSRLATGCSAGVPGTLLLPLVQMIALFDDNDPRELMQLYPVVANLATSYCHLREPDWKAAWEQGMQATAEILSAHL